MLSRTKVTNEGFKFLSEGDAKFPKLQEIHLASTNISDDITTFLLGTVNVVC